MVVDVVHLTARSVDRFLIVGDRRGAARMSRRAAGATGRIYLRRA